MYTLANALDAIFCLQIINIYLQNSIAKYCLTLSAIIQTNYSHLKSCVISASFIFAKEIKLTTIRASKGYRKRKLILCTFAKHLHIFADPSE